MMIFKQESDILPFFIEKCLFHVDNGSKKGKDISEKTD